MAQTLKDYASKIPVFYNGDSLEQVTSVGIKMDGAVQRIETIDGLAGFSDGVGMVTIELGIVLPVSGQEKEFQQDYANRAFVDMQFGIGRDSYAARGKLESISFDHSTNGPVSGTLSWAGPLKPFD